jgi:putative transposase
VCKICLADDVEERAVLLNPAHFDTKLKYIHLNPVRAGLVEKEEEYLYNTCGDY